MTMSLIPCGAAGGTQKQLVQLPGSSASTKCWPSGCYPMGYDHAVVLVIGAGKQNAAKREPSQSRGSVLDPVEWTY